MHYSSCMRSRLLLLGGLLALTGCGDDDGLAFDVAVPTEVAVDPADFLGEASCGPLEGSVQSYVLTLLTYDDENDDSPVVVGSTGAVSCASVAGFRNVIVAGARYTAEVDAYPFPPGELTPVGGNDSGARAMERDGAQVIPRWSTTCGAGAPSAVVAVTDVQTFVRPCEPLADGEDAPATRLSVAPAQVLGPDPCAAAASFDLTSELGGLPSSLGLACDGTPLVYDAVAEQRYRLYARADRLDGRTIGTVCEARGKAGLTVEVTCGPVSDRGAVQIDLSPLTQTGGDVLCPEGAFYDVQADGEALNPVPVPCGSTTSVTSVLPGIRSYEAVVFDAGGVLTGQSADCTALVEAGRSVDATCAVP